MNHQVLLESRGDALYLGTVNLGSPFSQPVKVAFDTGSEFLTVTSSFCDDSTTPEEYAFRKVDTASGKEVNRTEAQKKSRCLSSAYHVQNSTSHKLL